MATVSLESLTEQLDLSDALLAGRSHMLQPQDLPGRYGKVVKAIDHLLQVLSCEAGLGGGWAVWFHGYVGRVTQDVDIVLPAGRVKEFLEAAALSGFDVIPISEGIWPKVRHKETDIKVDILPEGGRPGTVSKPAPTTIPSPARWAAPPGTLQYVPLPVLIERKLAAGRARDQADVVELIRANGQQVEMIRQHLATVHADYVRAFDELVDRARQQRDE